MELCQYSRIVMTVDDKPLFQGEGAACGALLEKGFTKSQQEEMVKVHNELR